MKIDKDGVYWGAYSTFNGEVVYEKYFVWFHRLDPEIRHWGYEVIYYDGPHESFGFWWFNICWQTEGSWHRWYKRNKPL